MVRSKHGFTIKDSKVRSALYHIHKLSKNGYEDEYAVVGGMAVQIYIYSKYGKQSKGLRSTGDIDISCTREFYYHLIESRVPFERDDGYTKTFRIRDVYLNVDIDKAIGIDKSYFKEILTNAQVINIDKQEVRAISLPDLILIKLDGYVSGHRMKDLFDVINLINAYEEEIKERSLKEKILEKYDLHFKHRDEDGILFTLLNNVMKRDERNKYRVILQKMMNYDKKIRDLR